MTSRLSKWMRCGARRSGPGPTRDRDRASDLERIKIAVITQAVKPPVATARRSGEAPRAEIALPDDGPVLRIEHVDRIGGGRKNEIVSGSHRCRADLTA